MIGSLDKDHKATSKQLLEAQRELQQECRTVEEEHDEMEMEAYDDVSFNSRRISPSLLDFMPPDWYCDLKVVATEVEH